MSKQRKCDCEDNKSEGDSPSTSRLNFIIMSAVTFTLCVVIVAMVVALMIGLFDTKVDNIEIFKLITPAFQTIIGGFIGILAGIKIGSRN